MRVDECVILRYNTGQRKWSKGETQQRQKGEREKGRERERERK